MANTSSRYNEKYRIFDVFDEKQVIQIKDYCRLLQLHDGETSVRTWNEVTLPQRQLILKLKQNKEAYSQDNTLYDSLSPKLFNTRNAWSWWTTAVNITPPIYSVMDKGDFYKPHIDDPQGTGMFSTTLFLDDADTYEGGELEIYINGKVESFKLNAGQCITYETGLPHQVKPVTSGTRRVIVFWAKATSTDFNQIYKLRENIIEQHKFATMLSPHGIFPLDHEDLTDDLNEFVAKPHVKLQLDTADIYRFEHLNNKLP